jgi:ribonucleoside-diphosphate reductase alpha chain
MAWLRTSGGKAPGHLPLKQALNKIEGLLEQAAGRALRPIEVYDINMFVAKAVNGREPEHSVNRAH